MLFNMAGNKKCHRHLVQKEIIYFLTFIFQTQYHMQYTNWTENAALKKTIKNILHIFGRLIHHSAMGTELMENNVNPIFSRVEQNSDIDSTYAQDLMYINKKLNKNSFGRSSFKRLVDQNAYCDQVCETIHNHEEDSDHDDNSTNHTNENQGPVNKCNVTGSTMLESCV